MDFDSIILNIEMRFSDLETKKEEYEYRDWNKEGKEIFEFLDKSNAKSCIRKARKVFNRIENFNKIEDNLLNLIPKVYLESSYPHEKIRVDYTEDVWEDIENPNFEEDRIQHMKDFKRYSDTIESLEDKVRLEVASEINKLRSILLRIIEFADNLLKSTNSEINPLYAKGNIQWLDDISSLLEKERIILESDRKIFKNLFKKNIPSEVLNIPINKKGAFVLVCKKIREKEKHLFKYDCDSFWETISKHLTYKGQKCTADSWRQASPPKNSRKLQEAVLNLLD